MAKVKKATSMDAKSSRQSSFPELDEALLVFSFKKAPLCRKLIMPRFGVHIVLEIPRSDIVTDRK